MRGMYLFILVISLVFSACGYVISIEKKLPYGVDSIFVEMFENKTEEFALESLFSKEFIRQLIRYLPIQRVDSKNSADAILNGTIVSLYIDEDTLYGEAADKSETVYRILATAEINLRTQEGKTIWCSGPVRETQHFLSVSGNTDVNKKNKDDATNTLIRKLSESVLQRLTERF